MTERKERQQAKKKDRSKERKKERQNDGKKERWIERKEKNISKMDREMRRKIKIKEERWK